MPISRVRPALLALGLLGLTALTPSAAPGQAATDFKPFRMEPPAVSSASQVRMGDLASGKVKVKGPDLAANRAVLQEVANGRVYRVTFESYYSLPDTGELRPRTGEQNLNVLIADLQTYILVPTPERDLARLTPDQGDFIVEFGAAVDRAVAAVFARNPPAIIRVNAARLMAEAAKSGAPAFGKSVTAMLTNTYFKDKPATDKSAKPIPTPPEVFYYALRAAENLLAAHDPTVAQGGQFANRHSLPDAELVPLVKLLEEMVVKGPPVADKAAAATVDASGRPIVLAAPTGEADAPKADATKADATKGLTPEQAAVVRYYRRAAIRALAKVRFDTVGGKGGPGGETRPAFTLAKVAVSDSTLSLPSSPGDAAEAVIGLAGMAPVTANTTLNLDAWSSAMAVGMAAYATPRIAATAADERSLPWKVYSARLNVAVSALKRSAVSSPRLRPFTQPLTELCNILLADIITPLEKDNQVGTDRPSTERLAEWRRNNTPKDPAGSFYSDSPGYKLNYKAN